MDYSLCLKRPFIWLSRVRHRCGYGVHSPFAFSLITDVIYEKLPYYSYSTLHEEEKKYLRDFGWNKETEKIGRLLFRLVNRMQPDAIVEIGPPCISSLYLKSAKPTAHYLSFPNDGSPISLKQENPIDFLYINSCYTPAQVEESFRQCVESVTPESLFVIRGIHYSAGMKRLWRALQEDCRVGITFDLYDVGLIFFDTKKIKQHYIVNF